MRNFYKIALISLLLGFASGLRADVIVLVHGYLSSATAWETSGVNRILNQNGWQPTGIYQPNGFVPFASAKNSPEKKVVLVELPSEAPLNIQANHLIGYLKDINTRFSGERLIIVGHSAGGLVARLSMVRSDIKNLLALVSIATPHLGTQRAAEALTATDIPFPLSIIPDIFGGESWDTLKRGRSLFVDLLPPMPGTFLFWLNQQRHPSIAYYSIVRGAPFALYGDRLVPGFSQDMNNVPALAGQSKLVTVGTGHELNPQDGFALLGILAAF